MNPRAVGGSTIEGAPLATVISVRRRSRVGGVLLRLAAGVLIALILLVAFAKLVDLNAVWLRLQNLSIPFALASGGVFLSAYIVRALRWRCLLMPHKVSVWRVIAIYQVAIFANWLLPVRGGEIVKSVLLRQSAGIAMSESLPTVAMDKAMDLLPAVVLVLVVPFAPFQLSGPLWVLLGGVLVLLLFGGLFLGLAAWRRRTALALLSRLTALLPKPLRQRIEPFLLAFVHALLSLVSRPRLLLVAAGFTAVAVCLDALFCLLAFQAIGATIAFPVVLYGYTLYNLGYILPTLPGQIGSNELIGLLVFSGLFQIDRADVAAMFLFSHPWTAILLVGAGLFSLATLGVHLSTVFRARPTPTAQIIKE